MSIIAADSLGGWVETYTGRKFYPLNPRAEDVDPVDIAHSLAMQCRYNGHSRFFYSVAAHSCVLADYVFAQLSSPAAALLALLHDASEAYCGDMVRPLKRYMPKFEAAEAVIHSAILAGLKVENDPEFSEWIKELDTRILRDERAQLFLSQQNEWPLGDAEPLGVKIPHWPAELARCSWLARFYTWHMGFKPLHGGKIAVRVFAITEGRYDDVVQDSNSIQ